MPSNILHYISSKDVNNGFKFSFIGHLGTFDLF